MASVHLGLFCLSRRASFLCMRRLVSRWLSPAAASLAYCARYSSHCGHYRCSSIRLRLRLNVARYSGIIPNQIRLIAPRLRASIHLFLTAAGQMHPSAQVKPVLPARSTTNSTPFLHKVHFRFHFSRNSCKPLRHLHLRRHESILLFTITPFSQNLPV